MLNVGRKDARIAFRTYGGPLFPYGDLDHGRGRVGGHPTGTEAKPASISGSRKYVPLHEATKQCKLLPCFLPMKDFCVSVCYASGHPFSPVLPNPPGISCQITRWRRSVNRWLSMTPGPTKRIRLDCASGFLNTPKTIRRKAIFWPTGLM